MADIILRASEEFKKDPYVISEAIRLIKLKQEKMKSEVVYLPSEDIKDGYLDAEDDDSLPRYLDLMSTLTYAKKGVSGIWIDPIFTRCEYDITFERVSFEFAWGLCGEYRTAVLTTLEEWLAAANGE